MEEIIVKIVQQFLIVKQAFEIISLIANKNPLEVVLKVFTFAGPRED